MLLLSPICNPCWRCIQAKDSPAVCTRVTPHLQTFYHIVPLILLPWSQSAFFYHFLWIPIWKCQNMTLHCFLGLCLNGIRFSKHLSFALFSLCSTWASFFRPLLALLLLLFFSLLSLIQWQHFCDWLNASAGPQGGWKMEKKKCSCVTVRAFIVALCTMPACTTLCVTL